MEVKEFEALFEVVDQIKQNLLVEMKEHFTENFPKI